MMALAGRVCCRVVRAARCVPGRCSSGRDAWAQRLAVRGFAVSQSVSMDQWACCDCFILLLYEYRYCNPVLVQHPVKEEILQVLTQRHALAADAVRDAGNQRCG